jgi:hypothetical protein
MISMLKRRIPRAKSVAGGFSARLVASWPSADLPPVRQIRMVAVPLMTEVPENTTLEAPAGFSCSRSGVADPFLGGIGLAGQQRLVDVEVPAFEQTRVRGNEIAGDQLDDIAGRQLADRNRDALPSRLTVACTATDARSDATAFCARTSWTKSKMTLIITIRR